MPDREAKLSLWSQTSYETEEEIDTHTTGYDTINNVVLVRVPVVHNYFCLVPIIAFPLVDFFAFLFIIRVFFLFLPFFLSKFSGVQASAGLYMFLCLANVLIAVGIG